MDKWQKQFVSDARSALDNFHIAYITDKAIDASANNTSRYLVYTCETTPREGAGEKLVVIRHPWKAMYEVSPGQYFTPWHFIEKFGSARGLDIDQYHGGEIYALLECMRLLLGIRFPKPEDIF